MSAEHTPATTPQPTDDPGPTELEREIYDMTSAWAFGGFLNPEISIWDVDRKIQALVEQRLAGAEARKLELEAEVERLRRQLENYNGVS